MFLSRDEILYHKLNSMHFLFLVYRLVNIYPIMYVTNDHIMVLWLLVIFFIKYLMEILNIII